MFIFLFELEKPINKQFFYIISDTDFQLFLFLNKHSYIKKVYICIFSKRE